jgi:pimeloyl-ACP methyl ester carboxylesterase
MAGALLRDREPERVEKLVLLSPGGLLPLVGQFRLRAMLMTYLATRVTVNSFMRWVGFTDRSGETDARLLLEVMYLGMKHFRFPSETLRVATNAAGAFAHGELAAISAPTLIMIGEREVIYDAGKALQRALQLIPDVRGMLIPDSSHDMVFTQRRVVDAHVVEFLRGGRGERAAA